jgi:hypothetical protein
MENTFTSTGFKLLRHPEVLEWAKKGLGMPVSLQVSPTSKCNLNCSFCSNTNREKDEELSIESIDRLLMKLKLIGLKTVEWTGGGDPTLYPHINTAITFAYITGLKQGLITNGIKVAENLTQQSLDCLHWLRISLNSLDYVDDIDVPNIQGTLGFSYVMNEMTNTDTIEKLQYYATIHNPAYVRIVPNCLATDKEQECNNSVLSEMVGSWGHPFFYQAKRFERPKRCWWGHYKPFALHDGFVYRCSSVVLNLDADRKFHERYRWCSIEDFPDVYKSKMIPFSPEHCNHCVFKSQNDLTDSAIRTDEMEDFI